MGMYKVHITPRGRGRLSVRTISAPNYATVRKQAGHWLEYGSEVTVVHPSGKVTQFTVRS